MSTQSDSPDPSSALAMRMAVLLCSFRDALVQLSLVLKDHQEEVSTQEERLNLALQTQQLIEKAKHLDK